MAADSPQIACLFPSISLLSSLYLVGLRPVLGGPFSFVVLTSAIFNRISLFIILESKLQTILVVVRNIDL